MNTSAKSYAQDWRKRSWSAAWIEIDSYVACYSCVCVYVWFFVIIVIEMEWYGDRIRRQIKPNISATTQTHKNVTLSNCQTINPLNGRCRAGIARLTVLLRQQLIVGDVRRTQNLLQIELWWRRTLANVLLLEDAIECHKKNTTMSNWAICGWIRHIATDLLMC